MAYALGLDTSFCIVGDSIVFLAAARDRYYCLPAGARAAFDKLVGNQPLLASDTEALAPLVRQGLVAADEQDATPITPCHLPNLPKTHLCAAPGTAVAHLASAVWYLARARAWLKRRTFATILAGMQAHRESLGGRPGRSSDDLAAVATAFQQTGLWMTLHNQCLPRSLALATCLIKRGHPATLVFGVKLRPFDAHCWVQCGSVVINDRIERVRDFTPILVV